MIFYITFWKDWESMPGQRQRLSLLVSHEIWYFGPIIAPLLTSAANMVFWGYGIWLYDCPFSPAVAGMKCCFPATYWQTLLWRSTITKIFRHLKFTLSKGRLSSFATVLRRTICGRYAWIDLASKHSGEIVWVATGLAEGRVFTHLPWLYFQ